MKLKKTIKDAIAMLFFIIVAIVIASGFGMLIMSGLEKNEVVTCNKLVSQSKEFKNAGFFITKIDDEMCRSHNIIIDAPVVDQDHSEIVE